MTHDTVNVCFKLSQITLIWNNNVNVLTVCDDVEHLSIYINPAGTPGYRNGT
jgi:hypothetical protein